MSRSIAGLSVIVTGGARGIGRAVVDRFARAGARVAVGDLDAELARQVADGYDDRVAAARLDVTDVDSWAAFLAEVAHLGPWDVLVNNAGIMPLGPVLEESERVARTIMDVNVHGVINGVKAVAPGMVERGHGHVVNVASAVGRVAVPHGATYSASKFAVVGFSEAIRQELAPQGVDVTVVLPTVVQTELAAGVPAARGIKPVTADDVAAVVESAVRRPKPELWVPRWTQGLSKPTLALPRFVQDAMSRATRAGDVLASADPAARAAYEERARRLTETSDVRE
ncbi:MULTISPECIES: SDR family oxidoreductase [unclassified Nocardioides]|uniref:SDR family oxidoreductase n=1 Tax=unclassified Nocardioides TaxID=2615069 RepID=UPI0007039459|nr:MULTISPECIES: SDR family oxidoreductase [unclassified Nocardioides]KRC46534.1 short-chain dehydrogenase [Nocardioides sp. Root79]KRC69877.1 short-chain dehydrogenase [Nocardioides sp. Root240]